MKLFSKIALLVAATALIAGCGGVDTKQFKQPKETAKIITTTSFHPSEENPAECGEPYDENDLYPNVTEYLDSYGNPLLKTWNHPDGTIYMYARFYYENHAYGQLKKVVQYTPPMKPKVAKFTRDKNGAVLGISETIILPDQVIEKKEITKEVKPEATVKETVATDTKTTVSEQKPVDDNQLQVTYEMERTDSVREVGSKVYDQQSGKLTMHAGTEYDKGEVKREFGKTYEYTPTGKIARIINHEGYVTSFYCWEYDDHGNWTHYRYYREPGDGTDDYSQDKEYTYNENDDWTRCLTTTNGNAEAIVLRSFEYLDK